MEMIQEIPINLPEMKEKLSQIKSRDKDLNFRGKKVEDYLNASKLKEYKQLVEDLNSLDIQRLRERQITLIVNVQPKDIDSLKIVLANENLTLKQEDLQKIVDTVKKYA